ncbi:hypothetical protein [Bosea sp. 2RAB26]|uniref:hypothetical protein n=1 Tax=Bosea sp. 2RAB26 TaxID=3237476 RepID=UPI003F90BE3A
MASPNIHPAAPDHLPPFITAPGETDYLMVAMAVLLLVAILTVGIIFFRLHTLPERMAHKSQKLQFEIVAVLGLLALFTHIHLFWVAGLLLALIDLPDFSGLFGRMAHALERIAGSTPRRGGGATTEPPDPSDSQEMPTDQGAEQHGRKKEPTHA